MASDETKNESAVPDGGEAEMDTEHHAVLACRDSISSPPVVDARLATCWVDCHQRSSNVHSHGVRFQAQPPGVCDVHRYQTASREVIKTHVFPASALLALPTSAT